MKKNFTSFLLLMLCFASLKGQGISKFTMTTNKAVGQSLSFTTNYGATLTVDWGDGTTMSYTSVGDSITGTLKGNTVTVNGYDISVIDCSNQGLTALTVNEQTELRTLTCHSNALTTLDLSKNTKLQKLNCGYNTLQNLALSTNVLLTELIVNNNKMSSLSLTNTLQLNTLICNDNTIASLTLTPLTKLKTIWCQNNKLTSLDASKCTLLETLICNNNQIATINTSGLTLLTHLWCDVNKITDLNTSTNSALKYLSANSSLISKLALTSPIVIQSLYLNENNLGYSFLPSSTSIATSYNYAPQNSLQIPATSINSIDLSAQLSTLNGTATNATFKWYNGGTQLVSTDDYEENNGVFTFKKPFDAAYCEISSTLFPQLQTITTTTTAVSVTAGVEAAKQPKTILITTHGSKLIVTTSTSQTVNIYSILGVNLHQIKNLLGTMEFTLERGTYIVNGTKVIL